MPQFPAQADFAKRLRRDQALLALAGVGAIVGLGPLALVGDLGAYAYFRHKENMAEPTIEKLRALKLLTMTTA